MVKLSSVTAQALISLTSVSLYAGVTDASYDPLWHPEYTNEDAAYARVIELQHADDSNGKLLATWEHWYSNGSAGNFIIRESSDLGTTWETIATVYAPEGVPNTYFYQPFLFEFPQQLGNYPEGTILLVGNLHDSNVTNFFSWRSADHGRNWDPIGIWQTGYSSVSNGASGTVSAGIWEPFLFLDSQERLVAVFSDERDWGNYSQMLVHVISEDGGDTWGDVVHDVLGYEQSSRPGMATVAKMDNGKYFMSYEWCDNNYLGHACSVNGKTSTDGVSWNPSDNGSFVSTPDGVQSSGSPYAIWDSVGKQLIVSSRAQRWFSTFAPALDPPFTAENQHVVHINTNYGSGDWWWASAPWYVPSGTNCGTNYSPNLLALSNGTILYSTNTQAIGEQCEESTGAAPIGILPYNSNFSFEGNAGWIEFDALWSVSDGQYNFAPVTTPATIVLTGSSGWTDYEISADVIVTSTSGVVGVLVRASNSNTAPNYLSRYTAVVDSNRGDLTLYQVGDTATTTLQTELVEGGVKVNQIYRLSLSVKGTSLVGTLSDGDGGNTTVSVSNDGLLRGAAGLYGSYGSGGFSNVQITSL
ncbi:hypothetical protein N7478_008040 [Penicillium angulare]|uniref:uncharacterized protein n=1 Tax=Penicillium angulare TaxID=116970 RepID=UPI0025416762|nr:uncharacterized protein N7478_008040 [Penicillium angulare]KAJ5272915.1 hypothetical protein N7478_008040 [Penicillium angulare]